MKKILFALCFSLICIGAYAQKSPMATIEGQRKYYLDIKGDLDLTNLNEQIAQEQRSIASGDRLALSAFATSYTSMTSNKLIGTVSSFVDLGIQYLTSAVKSHRADWQQAVILESSFQKRINMPMNVPDFYKSTSTEGALDLTDINFGGFTCRQCITVNDTVQVKVMEAEFILDTTQTGIQRMLHHSKFQLKLKSLEFHPYLCEIPNDSINDMDLRVPLDFAKRKNFTVRVNTTIKSSWINEAIMITEDQSLGSFTLEFKIEKESLDSTGCFRYTMPDNPEDEAKELQLKKIMFSGESFMVPRSFIGVIDGRPYWGTGNYKIEVTLNESCLIDERYYTTIDKDGKIHWDRSKWYPEWEKIKKREAYKRKMKQPLMQTWERVKTEWTGGKWVTEIVSPSTKILLNEGSTALNELLSAEAGKSPTSTIAAGQSTQMTGTPPVNPR